MNCSKSRGVSEAIPIRSKAAARNVVRASAAMKTGTAIKYDIGACSPATSFAARTTRLPVICAVNNPFSPRKPMVSVLPAMMLTYSAIDGSAWLASLVVPTKPTEQVASDLEDALDNFTELMGST